MRLTEKELLAAFPQAKKKGNNHYLLEIRNVTLHVHTHTKGDSLNLANSVRNVGLIAFNEGNLAVTRVRINSIFELNELINLIKYIK